MNRYFTLVSMDMEYKPTSIDHFKKAYLLISSRYFSIHWRQGLLVTLNDIPCFWHSSKKEESSEIWIMRTRLNFWEWKMAAQVIRALTVHSPHRPNKPSSFTGIWLNVVDCLEPLKLLSYRGSWMASYSHSTCVFFVCTFYLRTWLQHSFTDWRSKLSPMQRL